MFELLEDQRKPEIKWWTIPSALFIILCLGINIGILVGRRSWGSSRLYDHYGLVDRVSHSARNECKIEE
jgi:hypothetical protein